MIGRKRLRQGDQWVADSVVHGSVFLIKDVSGDVGITVHNERPLYKLDAFPLDRRVLSVERARLQPARLLHSRFEVVDFTGRRSELARLAAWRDSGEPVSALLLHGVGGQGKTRLATEFARRSRTLGWRVLQARHASDPADGPPRGPGRLDGEPVPGGTGTLLVVDYADRWPAADLLELCADATRQPDRTRVLLVARAAGVWWQTLAGHDLERMEFDTDRLELGPLADGTAGTDGIEGTAGIERDAGDGTAGDGASPNTPLALFTAACTRFAEALRITGLDDLPPPRSLGEDEGFREALAVHMAALAWVDAVHRSRRDGSALPELASPAQVSAHLLTREGAYWRDLHRHGRTGADQVELGRGVYVAALIGRQTYDDALEAVARATAGSGAPFPPDRLLRDHATAYPESTETRPGPDGPDAATFLEPLYPDRLAEDFLALSIPGQRTVRTYQPDPRLTVVPARLLGTGDSERERFWTRTALTVLAAAAARWPHLMTSQIAPLLGARPVLAVRAGGAALAALADLPDLPREVLEAVEAQLPAGRHTDLDAGSAVVAFRLAVHRLSGTQDPVAHAVVRQGLVLRLANAGLNAEALTTARDAMPAWRVLAEADPETFERGLAGALVCLAGLLPRAGSTDEGLSAAREGVDLFRRSLTADPGDADLRAALAGGLSVLADRLSAAHRVPEALAAAREAVALYRPLGEAGPHDHGDGFAAALDGLGSVLSAVGRYREALEPAREAEAILRGLAEAEPARYAPNHARVAARLGFLLTRTGRSEEAVARARGAVETYRPLAGTNPAVFESGLNAALTDLIESLWRAGQREEALARAREAVDISRRLAGADPATHDPALAADLSRLGSLLSRSGRRHEAVAPLEEAVELGRRLVASDPDAHASELGAALGNLGELLWWVGDPQDALARTREAVEVLRRLVDRNPAVHRPALANALNSLGIALWRADLPRESVAAAQESADLHRELAREDPAAHGPGLAMALNNLSARLLEVGRFEAALGPARESVALRSRLVKANAAAHAPGYAMSLTTLATLFQAMGRPGDAVAPAWRSVAVRKDLAGTEPAAHRPGYGRSLGLLAAVLLTADRPQEAAGAARAAVAVHRAPGAGDSSTRRPDDLGLALGILVSALIDAGRAGSPDALDAALEGVRIFERLARGEPAEYGGKLRAARSLLTSVREAHR
ncbi:tetratricopeptide repeat protein [Kitasatospora sp. NPDC015120]|uniref:tetratricopeptide repeat protein n=1 Tax=Kitasatospora sp. NPDC015120 TaxID=3364023 RepID=UPI0036F45776